ncbi:hypothetical protein KEM54_006196 [Ascosphaera aggregata]|nr:hypothetical protein KEM54_006196 [Ascosphaera aggregata]
MPKFNERSARAIESLRAYGTPETYYYQVPFRRRAAVLLLLYADKRGDLRVIITIRSSNLNSFPGHAALPGGRADSETETPFQTARREANEEIGLPKIDDSLPAPFSIEHLCELPCAVSVTNLAVRPCVALLLSYDEKTGEDANAEEAFIPRLDAKEVAAVFSARFHNFLSSEDEVSDGEERTQLPGDPKDWYFGWWSEHNGPWRVHNFYVPIVNQRVTKSRRLSASSAANGSAVGHDTHLCTDEKEKEKEKVSLWGESCMGETRYRVWGLTARLLVDAARIAYDEEPQFDYNKKLGEESVVQHYLAEGRFHSDRARH